MPHDHAPGFDPAGLYDIRDAFQAETARRWTKTAREIKRAIVSNDVLGAGPNAPVLAQPVADKAALFRRWVDERLMLGVVGHDARWLKPHIDAASSRGHGNRTAPKLVDGISDDGPVWVSVGPMVTYTGAWDGEDWQTVETVDYSLTAAPSAPVCHSASVAALAGICEATSQRVHDAALTALQARQRPAQIGKAVDRAMGEGLRRSRMLAEHAVTQAYSQAVLDVLEAQGVTHVGTVSERAARKAMVDSGFDPDEPRNEHGEWSASGAGAKLDWSEGFKSERIGEATLNYSRSGGSPGIAEVSMLSVPKEARGAGHAGRAMKAFTHRADKEGTTLFLTPEPHTSGGGKGLSKSQLVSFYGSFGFVKNKGKNADFRSTSSYVRAPQTPTNDALDALFDHARKTAQSRHPRTGKFASETVARREIARNKSTGRFGRHGRTNQEALNRRADKRFANLEGEVDVVTADDDRVCDVCDGISAGGPYTIKQARSLIPAHPNCRCVIVAAGSVDLDND